MADVVVIGAGICGLGTALLLARDGHNVTVLERDASDPPERPEDAWAAWSRKGIAQFRQPHNFMPGLRAILERELPDLQDAIRDAGAARFDLINPSPFPALPGEPADDRFWTYTSRRPTGEWVFARAAHAEPRITLRRGVKADRLLEGPSVLNGTPHVTGIATVEGEEIRADLVVDATGRASRSPRWLQDIGARPAYEEQEDCGFTYYTRYFSGKQPQRIGPPLTPIGTISVLTLPGDNGTWSVTIFASSQDKAMKPLRVEDTWTSVIRVCPLQAHWLDGEPITPVLMMGGMADRYRRFVVDGASVATGFVSVADAWACTNPSAGRGMTVGFIHAVCLRDALRDFEDPADFAQRFDAVTEREVAPWYHAQVAADRYRFAQIEALRNGREPPPPAAGSRDIMALFQTMLSDPMLFRAGLEYLSTLTPVQQILMRDDVRSRMAAALEDMGRAPPPQMPGPDRAQLLALMG